MFREERAKQCEGRSRGRHRFVGIKAQHSRWEGRSEVGGVATRLALELGVGERKRRLARWMDGASVGVSGCVGFTFSWACWAGLL
jgi:hypothetical protein